MRSGTSRRTSRMKGEDRPDRRHSFRRRRRNKIHLRQDRAAWRLSREERRLCFSDGPKRS
jgi:hypothetical protein